ncbi:hypothetical protein F4556_007321 [Kitasatospora gansuensis]|uniref:PET hydrolase/cutinase-like domain-containing protein n=1 Tax=Kitasatospora gansuensis TaxID=258050 RepID=A0A7W7SJU4_9ACTN|nr:hypothetical protein [Kitasatospora gansuensis]MBB4951786.1 hypothetical protein [Kitasatospora gansuensis]
MDELPGRVEAPEGAGGSYAGHRVLLTYRRSVPLAAAGDGRPVEAFELADAASAPLAEDGRFRLTVADLAGIRPPLEIAVLAPSGAVVHQQELDAGELTEPLVLVAAPAQPFVVRPSDDPALGRPGRITGRVIGKDGRPAPADLPVVFWGLTGEAGAAPRALLTTRTQVGGYFSAAWPPDTLVAAYAEAGGGGGRAPVTLEDGRLPHRVVLVVELPEPAEDCSCAPAPPRAPDQQDLTANPAAFSQDLGTGCVRLTMPNRVVEEYSYFTVVRVTEPEVRAMGTQPPVRINPALLGRLTELTAEHWQPTERDALHAAVGAGKEKPALLSALDARQARELLGRAEPFTTEELGRSALKAEAADLGRLVDLLGARPTRTDLNGSHPIDWDDAPTIYEATTVALGHVLHYRQVWRADGYSLGDLLYSLPLAPGQKRLVSMVDWTRRSTSARNETLESEEQLDALAERDRDISEIVGSHLDERIDGGSRTSTSAGGGGIGAGFIGTGFGVLAGVAGGASSSSSSSWQDSSRSLSANALQQLRDRTVQRASAVRSIRSTVVQTVSQGESVRAETEVVANHNHCHALTVEYFEVLRHFQVGQELAQVTECLFVPLPMYPFDRAKARRWRSTLLAWLRRPELAPGFDAIERIATAWEGWDYPEHRFSEEAPEELDGELRISFVIPRPRDDEDGKYQVDRWSWLAPFLPSAPFGIFNEMADHVNHLFRDVNRQLTAEFATQIQRARDAYFAREIAPRVAERIVHRMRFAYVDRSGTRVALPMDATLISRFAEGVPLYVGIRASGDLPSLPREFIARFAIHLDDSVLGQLLDGVPADARIIVHSGKARYRSPHLSHLLFDEPRIDNDLGNGDHVVVATPTSQQERTDPRAEDRRLADELVKHLNEHLEFYHQAIWLSLDPQRRYLLLDGVIAPGSGGRSVAGVVENRLIGVVGNSLVLPVTSGIHLDPTLAADPQTGERVDLVHAYAAEPPPPLRISVPTRGVYAEAVNGECNACERKDDTRFWHWEESPLPDEPTPIEAISTDSRQAPETAATPTPLPRPIVNIQAAAALPDPLGLGQALEILGRADVFREASGLAGTQRNALAAFQGVMDTAQAFGGMAAKLAQQQETGRTVDRTMEQIKNGRQSGMLSQQQAQDLAHAALQALAGQQGEEQQNPVHDPAVSEAIEKATEAETGSVTVTSPGETVHADFDGPATGGVIGAVPVPESKVFEDRWVSLALVKDDQQQTGGFWKYDASVILDDLAKLRSRLLQLNPGTGIVEDAWPALEAGGWVRQDPADATKFQVRVRMQVTYPTRKGKPGKVAPGGKLPVVVLTHGQHDVWASVALKATPSSTLTVKSGGTSTTFPVHDVVGNGVQASYQGYTYLQEELARQGIISVSVDASLPNHLDLLIDTRAELVVAALDYLADEAKDPASILLGRVDLDRVGLLGHSRGGDAVARAALRIAAPISPKYKVEAVCLLAPTDNTGSDAPSDRMVLDTKQAGFALVVYGALDGDVKGLQGPFGQFGTGFRHYDRARCPKAMVFLERGCHNSFNSVWHAGGVDTSDSRTLGESEHRKLAVEYIGEFFRWRLKKEALAARFDGRLQNSLKTPASLQWMFGSLLKRVDDFEQSANLLGGARNVGVPLLMAGRAAVLDTTQLTQGTPATPVGRHMPHRTSLLQLDLESVNAAGVQVCALDVPPGTAQDWFGFDVLLISLAGFFDPTSEATVAAGPLPRVRVVLSSGMASAVVDFKGYGSTVPSRPTWTKKNGQLSTLMRLETVPIALSAFTGINRHQVDRLVLELEPTSSATVYVDNIHLVKR